MSKIPGQIRVFTTIDYFLIPKIPINQRETNGLDNLRRELYEGTGRTWLLYWWSGQSSLCLAIIGESFWLQLGFNCTTMVGSTDTIIQPSMRKLNALTTLLTWAIILHNRSSRLPFVLSAGIGPCSSEDADTLTSDPGCTWAYQEGPLRLDQIHVIFDVQFQFLGRINLVSNSSRVTFIWVACLPRWYYRGSQRNKHAFRITEWMWTAYTYLHIYFQKFGRGSSFLAFPKD